MALVIPSLDETLAAIRASVTIRPFSPTRMRMAQHPLYHQLWLHEDIPPEHLPGNEASFIGAGWLRKHIEFKLERLSCAAQEGDWETYVFVHERPYRVEALFQLLTEKHINPDERAAKLILDTWIDTEFPGKSLRLWSKIFGSLGVNKMRLLNGALYTEEQEHRERFAKGVGTLTLYRGCNPHINNSDRGYSWTSDRKIADFFAERLHAIDNGMLVVADVPPWVTVGPIMRRGESEYLVLDRKNLPSWITGRLRRLGSTEVPF